MKKILFTLLLISSFTLVKAQQVQQPEPEKPQLVLIQLQTLKKILEASGNLIAGSNIPYKDAAPVLAAIQQIYPQLVEMKKDTVKAVPPKAKSKK